MDFNTKTAERIFNNTHIDQVIKEKCIGTDKYLQVFKHQPKIDIKKEKYYDNKKNIITVESMFSKNKLSPKYLSIDPHFFRSDKLIKAKRLFLEELNIENKKFVTRVSGKNDSVLKQIRNVLEKSYFSPRINKYSFEDEPLLTSLKNLSGFQTSRDSLILKSPDTFEKVILFYKLFNSSYIE
jgi:hypothetical protein